MSLCYKTSSELNMVLYVGKGFLRPSDFFALEKKVFLENHRQRGMITLVDALDISTYFEREDIQHFIDNIVGMANNGVEPGPYVMITNDKGIHLLAQAVNLMAGKVDLKIHVHYTLQDAISALGLSDHKLEIVQLWNECRTEALRNNSTAAILNTLKQEM